MVRSFPLANLRSPIPDPRPPISIDHPPHQPGPRHERSIIQPLVAKLQHVYPGLNERLHTQGKITFRRTAIHQHIQARRRQPSLTVARDLASLGQRVRSVAQRFYLSSRFRRYELEALLKHPQGLLHSRPGSRRDGPKRSPTAFCGRGSRGADIKLCLATGNEMPGINDLERGNQIVPQLFAQTRQVRIVQAEPANILGDAQPFRGPIPIGIDQAIGGQLVLRRSKTTHISTGGYGTTIALPYRLPMPWAIWQPQEWVQCAWDVKASQIDASVQRLFSFHGLTPFPTESDRTQCIGVHSVFPVGKR